MKNLKIVCLTVLSLGVSILIAPLGWVQPRTEIKAPVITNAYAPDQGPYGTILKIYIQAEARGTEMAEIATTVDQPGQGHYPTDFTFLKPAYGNHLNGYLQWNTFSSRGVPLRDGDQIIIRVSVIDKAGNESGEAVFPFIFLSGAGGQGQLPAAFNQGDLPRLGYINIDLISQWQGGFEN